MRIGKETSAAKTRSHSGCWASLTDEELIRAARTVGGPLAEELAVRLSEFLDCFDE